MKMVERILNDKKLDPADKVSQVLMAIHQTIGGTVGNHVPVERDPALPEIVFDEGLENLRNPKILPSN